MKINDLCELFEKELRLRGYAYNSIINYSSCLKTFIFKAGEQPTLDEIKDFLLTLNSRNYHKQMTATIHHYFKLVLKKPFTLDELPYPKKQYTLPNVLSQSEIKDLFAACDNEKHKAILGLLYGCGLRISEVINMKPEHIDSKRMVIKIVQAKGNRDRYVPLSIELLELLKSYAKKYKPKTYLFNGQGSIQYAKRSVAQFLDNYAKKAGIKKNVYPHLLRHSYACHLVEMGTDMALIQKALGHANQRTTLLYAKISKNVLSKMPSPLSVAI